MEAVGVLMVIPLNPYLEQEIATRFNLLRLWDYPSRRDFLAAGHTDSIRAVICTASVGADAELIESLPNLEIVSSYSVGIDKIDLPKYRERKIKGILEALWTGAVHARRPARSGSGSGAVGCWCRFPTVSAAFIAPGFFLLLPYRGSVPTTNTPDVLTADVADLAIGLALATMRRICSADGFVRCGNWKSYENFELTAKLTGKSVGVLGLGRIGLAIAKRAEAFVCPISYSSRSQKPYSKYKYQENLIELASNSDILFLACCLTQETHHIITRQVMDALGAKGILVNIGRGALVEEPELVSALVEGRLGGAGLDVYEKEPDVPEELFGLKNVVLTSHVGTDTNETCKDMADLVLKNLEAHFQNESLLTPVD